MRATDFEYRHQTLVHLLIVAISFLTYLIDRDDIVWALVRGQPHQKFLERLPFRFGDHFYRCFHRSAYMGSRLSLVR